MCTYAVWGTDGKLGVIGAFLVADPDWTMPYFLIEMIDEYSLAKTVIVRTTAITSISWWDKKVQSGISRRVLRECPYFPSKADKSRRASADVEHAIFPAQRG